MYLLLKNGWVFQPARLIYQKVDPGDTTRFPSWNGAFSCRNIRFRWARSRTWGGDWGHENPNEFSRSFDVFFYWKTHPTPKKIRPDEMEVRSIFQKWCRSVLVATAVCLWLFGVTSWFKCTRAEGRTLYVYWIFHKSQDYGRWAVIKTLRICCIWGIILPSYNIGTSESLADIIHSCHLSGDQFTLVKLLHPPRWKMLRYREPTHLSKCPKFLAIWCR